LQRRTVLFLAHLVDGCNLSSTALQGMLALALDLDWGYWLQEWGLLASSLTRRVTEAADAGLFSSPDSPLSELAARHAAFVLAFSSEC
jgi:hypothetical protein